MKSIILQQKAERDKLLEMRYQERFAMAQAVSYRDSRPIKLITGPRRAGKSVLALQMLKGQNFAYLNFDDAALLEMFDENDVEQALAEVYPDYAFLLLDEIQNQPGWSLWVEKLYRRGVNLVITGSNANMLSDDIAAVLSGRYLEIRLYPFSAGEYLRFLAVPLSEETETPEFVARLNSSISKYMEYGGYPEIVGTEQVAAGYLSGLYDSIIVKDIVRRYKIRKVDDLYGVADRMLSNFTNPFSASSVRDELEMPSTTTVQKYLAYLQNTYLFQYLPRFSNKLKLMKKADAKCYVVDNGFIMARAFELSGNYGRLLENMVFMELLKRGYDLKKYELFYYRSRNDKETDFVCRRGVMIEQLIQVCYRMDSKKTFDREILSLVECAGELKNSNLTVITWDQEDTVTKSGYTIKIVPFRKWIVL